MDISFSERLIGMIATGSELIVKAEEQMGFWKRISPPEDISSTGHLIEWLFFYTTYVNIFWFALVCFGIFGFSFLYSKKRHAKPLYTHGNEKKHLLLTAAIGLGVFLSVDMVITKVSTRDLKETFWNFPENDPDTIKVQVLAQQWAWNFRHAGKDGEFNTADDVVELNNLVVPVGKKVMIQMTSKDVIHAFYLPNARIKADAIPGRFAKLWFDTNKTGHFEIACAEMCGNHHYLMKAQLTVLSAEDYERWTNESQERAIATNDTENMDLRWGWQWGSK
ncbi:cytochrome c oxidase subunit II [Peredibacter sp. HCB2-198]|uniref:cytochrome c oxidase subunit II n=1 Tax=Peredibacter sp. HCB2-198 TaxID=3383025 RepID=UPI0038B4D80F